MKKVEVFFDYNCPYCFKGHQSFAELLRDKPDLEVVWHPCEISVYKDPSVPTNNDISLQAMYYAAEQKLDLMQFHEKVYNLIFTDKINTHDIDTFVNSLAGFLDAASLRHALENRKYLDKLKASNHYAFKETGVHVVPTYRADGGFLQDRQEFYGLGVSDTSYHGTK
jgi:predicted DsbA family dithiol-disulfide isomerase